MLTKIDEIKIVRITTKAVVDALNDVVVPALDAMEYRLKEDLASKKDLGNFKHETGMRFDSLDRKLNSIQERLDRHNERIETLEKIHPNGKHPGYGNLKI